jgi:hypothetical protein
MVQYLIPGSTGNPEPPKSYDKNKYKFVIARLPGTKQNSGFLIPRDTNTQYVQDYKADKVIQDAAKLYKPVTIYGDDSPEIAEAKLAVAQKRQAAITAGGFASKAILEDKPMDIQQTIKDAYSDVKSGVNTGNLLKALGIGAGGALVGASAYVLLSRMKKDGGSSMGLGNTYQAVDDFLGGYLPGGITPSANVQLDAQAGIVKRYPNGMYRFANGRMGIIGKDGLLKTWKPYRSIVIGKRPTIGQLSRVVRRAKVWQKGLNKLLR